MSNIKFYMQKVDVNENLIDGTLKDLEVDFSGMLYYKCEGLLNKGKRKDIVIESHANSDKVRVWQSANLSREETNITFTFYFKGEERLSVYEQFYEYVKDGIISYWDTKRLKEARLVLVDALEPSNDLYKGSEPYISADFKFKNLWGECKTKVL